MKINGRVKFFLATYNQEAFGRIIEMVSPRLARVQTVFGTFSVMARDLSADDRDLPMTSKEIKASLREYTQVQLTAAFEMVENKIDWRNPIDAIIRTRDFDRVKAAIIHFTATVPAIMERTGRNYLRIKAAGYRAGPAGP